MLPAGGPCGARKGTNTAKTTIAPRKAGCRIRLNSAKGAARTSSRGKDLLAPHSVLCEFLGRYPSLNLKSDFMCLITLSQENCATAKTTRAQASQRNNLSAMIQSLWRVLAGENP